MKVKSKNDTEFLAIIIPKKRVCINCGKKFKDKQYYYKPCRGSAKPGLELLRHIRTVCCSDKCFYDFLNKEQ